MGNVWWRRGWEDKDRPHYGGASTPDWYHHWRGDARSKPDWIHHGRRRRPVQPWLVMLAVQVLTRAEMVGMVVRGWRGHLGTCIGRGWASHELVTSSNDNAGRVVHP